MNKLFNIHKFHFISRKNNSSKTLEKLTVQLLARTDYIWSKLTLNEASTNRLSEFKSILNLILHILEYFQLTVIHSKCVSYIQRKWQTIFPNIAPLSLDKSKRYYLPDTENRFQLVYLSEHLRKEVKLINDKRTSIFKPDEWQVDFLDAIDKNESVLIIAPTSSGKTYASFYAMEQIIKSEDDSILIYVAPTKALVNQTAFAVMKTFENVKLKGQRGKQLCGVFTRDFKNSIMNSKIIVTVPQCLFILLINYFNTNWPNAIRYVVFDEIHTMGGEKGTDVWEYLFLLLRCPFIALR